jgi:TetR/AcrR family transcriptional repressor of nem operon
MVNNDLYFARVVLKYSKHKVAKMARKLEFDKNTALQKAMLLFWEKGFEASSMEDLVNAMEINRFSIYNSFGDKKRLLILALEHYRENVLAKLLAPLYADLSPEKCLENYLDNMGKQLQSTAGSLGCFIQRTGQSHISTDPEVSKMLILILEELRGALISTISRARYEKSLQWQYNDEVLADFILSQIQGLIVLRRATNKKEFISEQIEILKKCVLH